MDIVKKAKKWQRNAGLFGAAFGIVVTVFLLSWLVPTCFATNLAAVSTAVSAAVAAVATYLVWQSLQEQRNDLQIQRAALADQMRNTEAQIDEAKRAVEAHQRNSETQERIHRLQLTLARVSIEKELRELAEEYHKEKSYLDQHEILVAIVNLLAVLIDIRAELNLLRSLELEAKLSSLRRFEQGIKGLIDLFRSDQGKLPFADIERFTELVRPDGSMANLLGHHAAKELQSVSQLHENLVTDGMVLRENLCNPIRASLIAIRPMI